MAKVFQHVSGKYQAACRFEGRVRFVGRVGCVGICRSWRGRQAVRSALSASGTQRPKMTFGFTPLLHDDTSGATVKIAIYRMTPNLSGPPQVLGSVVVAPGWRHDVFRDHSLVRHSVLSVEQP